MTDALARESPAPFRIMKNTPKVGLGNPTFGVQFDRCVPIGRFLLRRGPSAYRCVSIMYI
ncbi:hypothetical protein BCEN4_450073 [Burkholderia cenocepacia]|nr:hypothetical protein BCEN4_450073 [Burkholderia cenocepacia]